MSTALLVMWLWGAQGQTVPHTDITGNFTARSIQIDNGKVVSVEHACITRYEDGLITYNECADPVDVPAVQRVRKEPNVWSEARCNLVDEQGNPYIKNCKVSYEMVTRWTCTDKSRILLAAEDGTKHCIKFGGR